MPKIFGLTQQHGLSGFEVNPKQTLFYFGWMRAPDFRLGPFKEYICISFAH